MNLAVDEGYIKFSLSMSDGDIPKNKNWNNLNRARNKLHSFNLIGVYPNGIGFGNVSIRHQGKEFIITGSATGGKQNLSTLDYCLVRSFDLKRNQVEAVGRTKASSESMTHGAIYSANEEIRSVIHFHQKRIFDSLLNNGAPKTEKSIQYGTPQMGLAMREIVKKSSLSNGFLVTEGHDEGVFVYASSIEVALTQSLQLRRNYL